MEDLFFGLAASIGSRVRFYFLKLINRPKSLKYLKGNTGDSTDRISHGCINIIIGFPILFLIIIGIAYVCFTFFD
ncbi:hypothetical protein FACS1894169_08370 [Bacteroidia bacterium]|nr:hypothetical protein FACS1894169_08370 [Bacteroidia bacterium]